jgi:hypothetical protein
MDEVQLRAIATRFRGAIEVALPRLQCVEWVAFKRFPNGACGDACDMLGQFLRERHKLKSVYVSANKPGDGIRTHAWLEADGLIIDITADQKQFPGNRPGVIVSHDSPFHAGFSVERRRFPAVGEGLPGGALEEELRNAYGTICHVYSELERGEKVVTNHCFELPAARNGS